MALGADECAAYDVVEKEIPSSVELIDDFIQSLPADIILGPFNWGLDQINNAKNTMKDGLNLIEDDTIFDGIGSLGHPFGWAANAISDIPFQWRHREQIAPNWRYFPQFGQKYQGNRRE